MSNNIFALKKYENKSYGKGIFINKLTVTNIEDISGKPLSFAKDWVPDCAVEVTFDTGMAIDKKIVIAGDFKRDASTKQPIGLGSAFKVLSFFQEVIEELEEPSLTEVGEIPKEYLTGVIGKEVYVLDYVYGFNATKEKPKYKSWDIMLNINADPAKLAKKFLTQVSNGFMDKYKPDAIPDKSDKEETTFPSIDSDGSEDDDLPF